MTAKSYTEEEIREIAERQNLVGYPHLALMREKLSVKAKNEPKFRFYNLKRLVGNILRVTGNRLRTGVESLARIEV